MLNFTLNRALQLDIIIGIILGIIIAYYVTWNDVFVGPASSDIKKRIYKNRQTNKCYKLKPKIYICPINKSMSIKDIK